jgi:hypothetical protein
MPHISEPNRLNRPHFVTLDLDRNGAELIYTGLDVLQPDEDEDEEQRMSIANALFAVLHPGIGVAMAPEGTAGTSEAPAMEEDFTPEQVAFLADCATVSQDFADFVRERFRLGFRLDQVRDTIRNAMDKSGRLPLVPRAVVVVSEGMVQAVITDQAIGVTLLDYDIQDANAERVVEVDGIPTNNRYLPQGPNQAASLEAFEDVETNPAAVDAIMRLDQVQDPAEEIEPTEAEISDWKLEVANGDTKRGLADWVQAQRESE